MLDYYSFGTESFVASKMHQIRSRFRRRERLAVYPLLENPCARSLGEAKPEYMNKD